MESGMAEGMISAAEQRAANMSGDATLTPDVAAEKAGQAGVVDKQHQLDMEVTALQAGVMAKRNGGEISDVGRTQLANEIEMDRLRALNRARNAVAEQSGGRRPATESSDPMARSARETMSQPWNFRTGSEPAASAPAGGGAGETKPAAAPTPTAT